MIVLTRLRDLNLAAPSAPGQIPHLSAASGLACIRSFMYVVADDELHLGVFRATGNEPGRLIKLFDGELPGSKADRKRQKPDLESLTLLPPDGNHPHGALLALGSGSTLDRRRGALLALDAQGTPAGPPHAMDCSAFLAPLADRFPALNIEGAVVCDGELRLFQRGNRQHPMNAIIRFPLATMLAVFVPGWTRTIDPVAIHEIDLGAIGGIPYSITDAAALPGGDMVFTAVAEDTQDSYNDGPCHGAAIGVVDSEGRLRSLRPLDRPYKVEGVDARVDGDVIRLLLVTDADDPGIPASLFAALLEK